jgi:hypothetical protein
MAYTKTLRDADEYFHPDKHMAGTLYAEFLDNEKKAAFAEAQRMLEKYLARQLEDPDNDVQNYDIRDDYAHFEQMLHLLRNSPFRANTERTGVSWDLINSDAETRSRNMKLISTTSMRWAGINPNMVVRG